MPVAAISEADGGAGVPFNVAARDAARSAGAASPQAPVMPPAAAVPVPLSGVPPQQPGQPSPAVYAALGLPVPPGTPQAQPPAAPPVNPLFAAMGLQPPAAPPATPPPAPVAPSHVDAAGQKIVENYSATIQRHAEQAYATALYRAKQDPTALDAMIASEDAVEKDIAKKLLERNPELFGAGNVEEYQAKKQLESAGSDPRDREIAQMKLDNAKRDQREADREWREWKKENGVKADSFGQLCDQVRREYPNSPKGDIVAIARGRAGIKPLEPSALDGVHVPPGGERGAPPEGSQPNSGAISALGLGTNEVSAAEAYFEQIGSLKGR